jgi:hypothetical protein
VKKRDRTATDTNIYTLLSLLPRARKHCEFRLTRRVSDVVRLLSLTSEIGYSSNLGSG